MGNHVDLVRLGKTRGDERQRNPIQQAKIECLPLIYW